MLETWPFQARGSLVMDKAFKDAFGMNEEFVRMYFYRRRKVTSWVNSDALSFYKEEIIYEESGNYISTLANSRGWEKRRAFDSVIDETVKAHEKALRILDSDKAALEAYKRFAAGYVYFHTGLDVRYHLDDLTLV
ncbi:hypothetical protein D9757_004476 [Collybiopsis confluens]|uniref:Uncharacterized protein n=1 Tax=Collybiopsis confluens TaxID=2823264 RepID=A0A8H5HWR5_9AGAR|nr:hypothetical protein D9757_004476 [Collybiopsis confluens]